MIKADIRTALAQVLGGASLALVAIVPAHAVDPYPTKPIRIVVASAPGGLLDMVTRMVAQRMETKLGQSIVVENRSGGGTLVGIRSVRSAPADGYTLLAVTNTITGLPAVKLEPGYDLLKDFTGIGPMARSPWMMVVGASQPDKNAADFIARAKAQPNALSFGSNGFGTTPYFAAQSFLQRAGVKALHVPYKGNSAVYPDLISGRVTMMFDGVGSAAAMVKGGQIRALGVSSTKRLPAYPDLPTLAEQGLPNYSSYFYVGLFAPARTPKDVVQKLSAAMQASSKELHDRLEKDGIEPMAVSPDEFNQSLKRELAEMAKLAADLGIQKE
ncbi:tripartite tricarboxylate transporter substrate binding protein [Cupriavidus basilensis]|uniref:Tripartite tricarboxylate transporter substrate binding protein n=1 Tax=Cupriavidus basilensis TaxID=68895 RepID=A0ABT6ASC5_9BURK|nr:tripartite tricarboxylate transporter substrate binding protein [Cupriavidus basilensis]MDF3835520.1 tripartite tricarboxylate transporter substrate binding protein [Cupriavidus basilensis]